MILIDVLRDENKNDHLENLKKLIKWIEEHETHRNSSNYFNLHEKINQFDKIFLRLSRDDIKMGKVKFLVDSVISRYHVIFLIS